MNTNPDMDVDHVAEVCASVAARPSTLRANGAEVTLLFPTGHQRDLAHRALTQTGYATTTGPLAGVHPNAVRVDGWSSEALTHRVAILSDLASDLDRGLTDAAEHALNLADTDPASAVNEDRVYDIAVSVAETALTTATDRAGPLAQPAHLPAEPEAAEHVRAVQRQAARIVSIIGDHFNIACTVTNRFDEIRRTHTQPEARQAARAEADLFLTNRVDPDAYVTALTWAHRHNHPDAAAFADHYAHIHNITAPTDRPSPAIAYDTWRTIASTPPAVAADDFPHLPTTGATPAGPEPNDTARGHGVPRSPGGSR